MAADACLVRRAVLPLGQQTGPPYQPGSLLMDTPLPLTSHASRRPPRMGTRQPIPLLPTGSPQWAKLHFIIIISYFCWSMHYVTWQTSICLKTTQRFSQELAQAKAIADRQRCWT